MLEGIIICVVLLVVQLVLLYWIDRRLDYAEMNSHYIRAVPGSRKVSQQHTPANDRLF